MKVLFESRIYPSLIYVFIILVLILITFNIIDIFNNLENKKSNKITGFQVSEKIEDIDNDFNSIGYPEKSYYIYLFIVSSLVVMIVILIIRIIFPAIKNYT